MSDKILRLEDLDTYDVELKKNIQENYLEPLEAKSLPVVNETLNGKILQVVDGKWAVVAPTTIYVGGATPTSDIGEDGDLYLQID